MLVSLPYPELFFGLCSPMGTNNSKAISLLSEQLKQYDYNFEMFKVTELMKSLILPGKRLAETPIDLRYKTYIDYANSIRRLFTDPAILASVCCAAAHRSRAPKLPDGDIYIQKRAYIFDQFKRAEEIEALRQTYGRLFVLISIYSDRAVRLERLAARISADRQEPRISREHENLARELIEIDEDERADEYGQRLSETFPLADLFIDIDDIEGARKVLGRFMMAFFGSNSVSPTPDEFGMYIAKSAALRSLDLSRQVGAAIFSKYSDVISLGCNEVPKFGGGSYWCTDERDARDFTLEHDENERLKRVILVDIARRIHRTEADSIQKPESEFVADILNLSNTKATPIRQSQLMDILEYNRTVHAEMAAITDAARMGVSTREAKMYVTTFPCHVCAKHIVASGIQSLQYIEPYPKSYAEHLHADAIELGTDVDDDRKCRFIPFIGIAPHRFRDLFVRQRRKSDGGSFSPWTEGSPKPIVKYTVPSFIMNETAAIKEFQRLTEELVAERKVQIKDLGE